MTISLLERASAFSSEEMKNVRSAWNKINKGIDGHVLQDGKYLFQIA